jgi:hypothetical protein
MERDMLGKMLIISLDHKLDIGLVLQYPLTPVPLVFRHLDGTVNRTDKAVLYKNLEKRVDIVGPELIDVYIVYGFFFVYLWVPHIPLTYEDIACTKNLERPPPLSSLSPNSFFLSSSTQDFYV